MRSAPARLVVLLGVVCLVLFGATRRAVASPVAQVTAYTGQLELAPYLEVLEDTSASLTIDDVRSAGARGRARPFHGRFGPSYGFTNSAVWVRVVLENSGPVPLERWLEIDHPLVDHLELYDGNGPPRVTGRSEPRSGRELDRRSFTFRIELPAGSARVVYLRATSHFELQLPMALWEAGALATHDAQIARWIGLAYGVMIALALYNAFLFFFVRDSTHLLYVGQVAGAALWTSTLDGTFLGLLPASVESLPRTAGVVPATAAIGFGVLFIRRFLQLPATHPRIDRAVKIYLGVLLVGTALGLVGVLPFRPLNLVLVPLALLGLVFAVSLGVLRWREGFGPARYQVFAWAWLASCSLIALLAVQGVLPIKGPSLFPHIGYSGEAILLSLALADAAKRRNEHVARLHAASDRFVPHALLNVLGRREISDVALGDQTAREMTTFFLDVRGFTSLVEGLTPEATIAFVNDLLARLEPSIRRHTGVIDKFMGDGIMAIFGRADDAVAAAVACLAALDERAAEQAQAGAPGVAVGIGIHTGPLVLGTVGTAQRIECTVIGDAVNLASRLESMTKTFGATILVSASTLDALSEATRARLATRFLGRVAPKGKAVAIPVNEILDGLPEAERRAKLASKSEIERGCGLFISGAFEEAARVFESCRAAFPSDRAAALYIEQCARRTSVPPPSSWDGAVQLDAK